MLLLLRSQAVRARRHQVSVGDKVVNWVPEKADLSICRELGLCTKDEERIVSLGDPNKILFISNMILAIETLSLQIDDSVQTIVGSRDDTSQHLELSSEHGVTTSGERCEGCVPSVDVLTIQESEILAINPVQFTVAAQISAQQQFSQLLQIGNSCGLFRVELHGLAFTPAQVVGILGHSV